MGLDMYLYRIAGGTKDIAEAIELENAFWKTAQYDAGRNEFINDGCERGLDEIAYWRKANQVHKWFMDNCGADNCDYYPVTRSQLSELLTACEYVIAHSELVEAMVHNGSRFENGEWVPIMEKGKAIKDASYAEELLPTCEGFFFGSTEYDEWYLDDLKQTVCQLKSIMNAYDDDTFYYYPSW